MDKTISDLIIVGGGSVGLSAALHLARMRRRVVVLDGGEPRNRFAAHMHGLLGRDGASPLGLLADGRTELARYGVEVRQGHAVGARRDAHRFVVATAGGEELEARQLLVATGLRDELPPIEGLAALWGRGVATCPYCDGWEVRDRSIGVLHGPRGPHLAQLLRELSGAGGVPDRRTRRARRRRGASAHGPRDRDRGPAAAPHRRARGPTHRL